MQKKIVQSQIPVKVKNIRKFQDIVTLIDRNDFRELFDSAIALLPEYKEDVSGDWVSKSLETEISRDSFEQISDYAKSFLSTDVNFKMYLFTKNISIKQSFSREMKISLENSLYFSSYIIADLLSQKFSRLGDYFDLIHALLIKRQVDENDYKLVQVKAFDPNRSLSNPARSQKLNENSTDFFSLPTSQKIAIYVSPGSRIKDIIDELESQNPQGSKNIIQSISSEMKHDLRYFDLRSNIKRDRKWYWMNKQGTSYREISKSEAKLYGGESLDYYENIKAAVQAYKKLLAVEI